MGFCLILLIVHNSDKQLQNIQRTLSLLKKVEQRILKVDIIWVINVILLWSFQGEFEEIIQEQGEQIILTQWRNKK